VYSAQLAVGAAFKDLLQFKTEIKTRDVWEQVSAFFGCQRCF
jgi:hypothetical protein